MAKAYEVNVVTGGYTGALKEFLLSRDFLRIPITIDRSGQRKTSTVKGPCLYGRLTASPGEYAPFFVTALLASQAAAGQKNIVLATTGDDTIANFKAGDTIMIMDDNAYEAHTIDTATVSTNTIAVTVNLTNTYTTAANAKVYLTNGTELSADAVIVDEDIDFSETSDVIVSGYQKGTFDETKIYRKTNFVKADCSRLDLRTLQR